MVLLNCSRPTWLPTWIYMNRTDVHLSISSPLFASANITYSLSGKSKVFLSWSHIPTLHNECNQNKDSPWSSSENIFTIKSSFLRHWHKVSENVVFNATLLFATLTAAAVSTIFVLTTALITVMASYRWRLILSLLQFLASLDKASHAAALCHFKKKNPSSWIWWWLDMARYLWEGIWWYHAINFDLSWSFICQRHGNQFPWFLQKVNEGNAHVLNHSASTFLFIFFLKSQGAWILVSHY